MKPPSLRSPLAVFCDFDGTFSVRDVGSTLAQAHLSEERRVLFGRYESGELDAWEYAELLFNDFDYGPEPLEAFLRTIELDPGARSLLAWCRRTEVPFRILSDGFSYNLERLQAIHDVRFEFTANHLDLSSGRWKIRPGGRNPKCACGTGSCKRAILEDFREKHPGHCLVHIGNGRVSDLCGAEAADVVFAKETLAEALVERGIDFHDFATLRDVVDVLERELPRTGS